MEMSLSSLVLDYCVLVKNNVQYIINTRASEDLTEATLGEANVLIDFFDIRLFRLNERSYSLLL